MAWEQTLGFFTMWLHPEFTVGLWFRAGVPLWKTLGYVTIWTSGTLILTYFGIDLIKYIVKFITKGLVWLIRFFNPNFAGLKRNHLQEKKEKYQKRLTGWLSRQRKWVVLVCSSIPFVPFLPAAVIITIKTIEIKRSLLILLTGNVFRNCFICFFVYYGVVIVQNLMKIFS